MKKIKFLLQITLKIKKNYKKKNLKKMTEEKKGSDLKFGTLENEFKNLVNNLKQNTINLNNCFEKKDHENYY